MNNVGKPALYNLTQPTVGTFFLENHLTQVSVDKISMFITHATLKLDSNKITCSIWKTLQL
jgi:hypothetical protein